jgi:drug/metabolite transporter (DMT)-like permease
MSNVWIMNDAAPRFGFSNTSIGFGAALGAVLIWAGWIVATRHAIGHAMDPAVVGLLRFAVPAIVFASVWIRIGLRPAGVSPLMLVALLGAGAPFFLAVAYAMRFAATSDVAPFLSGLMPMIVALASIPLFGERLRREQMIGLCLIALGIAAISGFGVVAGGEAWRGHLLLLAGAGMWATYTLAFKRSGLTAVEAAAVGAIWSTLLLLPLGGPQLVVALQAGLGLQLFVQAVIQGVLSGVLAIVLYGVAITKLGASRGAACVALVPAFATLMAMPVLGELPGAAASLGVVAVTLGVALASARSAGRAGVVATRSVEEATIATATLRCGGR